jgi:beta-galactosidase
MQALVKRLDPTRPVTAAVDRSSYAGIDPIIEVRGWNYHIGAAMDEFHRSHPEKPNVGTEQGSTVGTRGIYADDKGRGYVSAYDDYAPEWANTAEAWWSFFDPRPWLSGGFVWTGFDYRGEPTPCAWPCISSHFGVLDTCGFPKDNFWYYKSWWTAEPVLHLMPHWNWAGREGQPIDVRALSNCDEVELFLNGRSLGRQTMKKDFSLRWQVPYEAGRLSARGYRNGNLAAETAVETAGPPARLSLEPDRSAIAANREDVAVITVGAYDAQGRPMPTASDAVAFTIEGPGKILGVGNGDPSCHEPDAVIGKSSTASLPIGGWKMKKYPTAGAEIPHATEASYDDSSWDNADVLSESGPLLTRESGVFRVHFSARAEDLAAPGVELWFGKIEGGGVVYVNGHNVGASNDPRYASVYDVKRLLHEGDNSIAVTISNWGAIAGINRGVKLRLTGAPAAVHWRRSLFNGLAQIIVQSTGEPGDIRLKAEAPGLKPAEITIAANPAPFRPALP